MAPEQAMGQTDRIDARSDQFALATITYELIAGRCAFTGKTIPTLLYQLVHEEPAPIVVNGRALPPSVDAVIRRGLAKEPANRFASVIDFARAFDAAVTESAAAGWAAPVVAASPVPVVAAFPATVPQGTAPVTKSPARPADTTLGTSVGEAPARARNLKPVVAIGSAAIVAVGLVLGLALRGHSPQEGGAAAPSVGAVGAKVPEPPVGSLVGSSTVPAFPPIPSAPAPAPASAAAAAAGAAAEVTIDVADAPPSLVVSVDGAQVGPPPVQLIRGSGRHELLFEAPGYRPYAKQLDSTQDLTLVLPLKRKPGGGGAGPRTASPSTLPSDQARNVPAAAEPPSSYEASSSAPAEKRKPGRFRKGVETGVDSVSNFAKRHFGSSSK
jgi:serine/threonine-protein kinase